MRFDEPANKHIIKAMDDYQLSSNKFISSGIMAGSNAASSFVVVGSSLAMSHYSTWQETEVNSLVTCYSITESLSTASKYIAELMSCVDPRTGCEYLSADPFQSATAFVRDGLYGDLSRYFAAVSAMDEFSKTFSGLNLPGDQLAVAFCAFNLAEREFTVCVIAHPSETALISLCQRRGWNVEIIDPYLPHENHSCGCTGFLNLR